MIGQVDFFFLDVVVPRLVVVCDGALVYRAGIGSSRESHDICLRAKNREFKPWSVHLRLHGAA